MTMNQQKANGITAFCRNGQQVLYAHDGIATSFTTLAGSTRSSLSSRPLTADDRDYQDAQFTWTGNLPEPAMTKYETKARQHGTKSFGQRAKGELLTVFILVSGKQDPSQWLEGGELYEILHLPPNHPTRIYTLPRAMDDPEGHYDMVVQFEDIRDADLVITMIREYNQSNNAQPSEGQLRALCISGSQFCNMGSRMYDAFPNDPQIMQVLREDDLPSTFFSDFDGQILFQGHLQTYNQVANGGMHPNLMAEFADACEHLVWAWTGSRDQVANRRIIGNEHGRPITVYHVELAQHGLVPHLLWLSIMFPHGICFQNFKIWISPYDDALFHAPTSSTLSLPQEELSNRDNAFRRRQHGFNCPCVNPFFVPLRPAPPPPAPRGPNNDSDDESDIDDIFQFDEDDNKPGLSSDHGALNRKFRFPVQSSRQSSRQCQSSTNTQSHDADDQDLDYDANIFECPGQVFNNHRDTGFFSLNHRGEARVHDNRQNNGDITTQYDGYQQSTSTQRGFGDHMPVNTRLEHAQSNHRGMYSNNNIDRARIMNGHEHRSTVMFRNIPSEMTADSFVGFINFFAPGHYSFVYLRMDFKTDKNVGYAFVDFTDPYVIVYFQDNAVGHTWPHSRKRIDMSFATFQGTEALVERFRNSVVMTEPESYRPRLYHTVPHPLAGQQMEFPKPDNQMKLFRSMNSAQDVGLFTPGKRGQFRRGQYDLGNPRGFTGGFHGGLNDGMSGDVRRLQDENAMLHERLAAFNMNV